jgi:uncharacterized protein YkwD
MRSLTRILATLGLALVLVGGLAPAAIAADSVSGSSIAAAELKALTLTNQRRVTAGLRPLRLDTRLAALARDRAEYMARTNVLSHTQANGTDVFDLIRTSKIAWYGAGEIIAWNTAGALDYSASFAVQGWMKSPGHKAIVLSKGYNYAGFGMAIAENGRRFWAGVYLKGPDRTGAYASIKMAAHRATTAWTSKVYFRWAGSDVPLQLLTSGLRLYETQRRVDGGPWASYGTTTSVTVTRYWHRGHTWDFRVRARDKAGNWGNWSTVTVKL